MAWMKLACFSDTHAVPIAQPAQAEPVDEQPGADLARNRVDEHRAGVLTTRLVLPTPPDDLGDLRLGGGAVTGVDGATSPRRRRRGW